MILKGAEAARYCAKPDPGRAGLLIFGADAMRVALKRPDAIAALGGAVLLAEPITARLLIASAAILGGIALTIRKKN